MELPIFRDILIIQAIAVLVQLALSRLKVSSTVALMVTGLLAGPHGLGLVSSHEEVEILAEIGVVFLLFTVGLEFSFQQLVGIRKLLFVGGGIQVSLTALGAAAAALLLGFTPAQSAFLAFLVAMSSTAIGIRLLQDRGELDSPHGRLSLGILIFQDLLFVPLLMAVPLLANGGAGLGPTLAVKTLAGMAGLALLFVAARWAVPRLFREVARTKSTELFLMVTLLLCATVAWATWRAGFSLALGAFLAGLVLSGSSYSLQALGNILPFRDVFTSFFFVSVGMLLDPVWIRSHAASLLGACAAVLLFKTLSAGAAALALRFPLRSAVAAGLVLNQVGEFSLVLATAGLQAGLLSDGLFQWLLSLFALSIAASPFLLPLAGPLAEFLKRALPQLAARSPQEGGEGEKPYRDHLIIVGFGVNGKNLARACRNASIPYVIIEMNPDIVTEEGKRGEPILFGDAAEASMLRHAGVSEARVLVSAISDTPGTRRIAELARRLNPGLHVIVRTRFVQEMQPLLKLGADEVIPEEFETSIEIFTRVLKRYLVPWQDIEAFTALIREEGYEMLRSRAPATRAEDLKVHLPDVELVCLAVADGCPSAGRTLAELDLRRKLGGSVVAVRRGGQTLTDVGGDTTLEAGDELLILGPPSKLPEAWRLFCPPGPRVPPPGP